MKIEITKEKALELISLEKTYMILPDGALFTLGNVKYEVETKKSKWFGNCTEYYLTSADFSFYFPTLKRWGHTTEDWIGAWVEHINFLKCRERWLNLHEALNANGMYITNQPKVEEPITNLNQNECPK
jgi:hypothetical protein